MLSEFRTRNSEREKEFKTKSLIQGQNSEIRLGAISSLETMIKSENKDYAEKQKLKKLTIAICNLTVEFSRSVQCTHDHIYCLFMREFTPPAFLFVCCVL